jgi:glutamyl endopeptidase
MPIVFRRSVLPLLICLGACSQAPYSLDEGSIAALDGALPDSDPGLLDELEEPGHELEGEELGELALRSGETLPLAPQLRAAVAEGDEAPVADQGLLFPGSPLSLVSNTTGAPYRTTVNLSVTWKTGVVKVCTGTLIAPDAVLTAAHCVYNAERGGWAYAITATPALQGTARPYYGRIGAKRSFAPYRYRVADPHPDKYPFDYGVVRLKSGFSFQPRSLGAGSSALARKFVVRGYPYSDTTAAYDGRHMYESRGTIRDIQSNGVFYHRASTLGGMSGGGIDDGTRIIGVHTSGAESDNGGVVFSPTTVSVINDWATQVL